MNIPQRPDNRPPADIGPSEGNGSDAPERQGNQRIGLAFFAVYLVLYVGFVLMNAFAPEAMERIGIGGINLALWSGLGLIVAAFALALVYGWYCRNE